MTLASRRSGIRWGRDARSGSANPNFSGGKYVDDKGYVRVLNTDHPYNNRGYVYEHRLVVEEFLGRVLEPWEIVHHINEIKIDNRVDNLFLTTSGEHSAIHREGKTHSAKRRQGTRKARKRDMRNKRRNHMGQFIKED